MPACFSLTRKGESKPKTLQAIDAELCTHFGVPCDPIRWYASWYNIIGFNLACGTGFSEQRKRFTEYLTRDMADGATEDAEHDRRLLAIVDYLDKHYVANNWRER